MKFGLIIILVIIAQNVFSGRVYAMANPASVFCEQQGYKNEIKTNAEGSQYGICIFPSGKECEEWQFYRGECGTEYKKDPIKVLLILGSIVFIIGIGGLIFRIRKIFIKK